MEGQENEVSSDEDTKTTMRIRKEKKSSNKGDVARFKKGKERTKYDHFDPADVKAQKELQERFKEQALKRAINLHNLGGDSVVIFLVSELLEVSEVAQYPENSIPKDVENNVVQLMTRALRKNPLNTIVQSNVSNFIDLKETSSIADAIVEREANDKKKIFKAGKDKMAKDTVQQEVSVEELKLAPKKSPRKKSPTKKSPARKLRPKKVSPTKSPKKAPIKAKK